MDQTDCDNSSLPLDSANSPQNGQETAYCVVQAKQPEENGAAALATIMRYYGMSVNLETVTHLIPTKDGTVSLLSLNQAAQKLGFSTRAVKGKSCDALLGVLLPAIAHEQTEAEQQDQHPGHFVVIFEGNQASVIVGNLSNGMVQKQPRHQFCQTWTGILLLLEPNT
jgi:ATP-binding cassette subfamily B protein